MGSKARVAKEIVPIIQNCINENNLKNYFEPFCGGCNIIDKIICENRYATDLNPYLIGLFKHLQDNGELLESVSRDVYSEVRSNYKNNTYPNWYVGNIGFLASYNGRFFDGGYAQSGFEKTKNGERRFRDYYLESSNNILKQKDNIKNINFKCMDYHEVNSENSIIYCDPPYQNQKQYNNSKNFDYDDFWGTVREWSKNNFVLVSELNAPVDFITIWQKSVSRSIKTNEKSLAVEKLFTYKNGMFDDYYKNTKIKEN